MDSDVLVLESVLLITVLAVISLPSFESQPVTNRAHADKVGVICQCHGSFRAESQRCRWSVGEAVMMGIMVDKGQNCPAPTSALCNAGQISGARSELPNTVAKHSILHAAVGCLLSAVAASCFLENQNSLIQP